LTAPTAAIASIMVNKHAVLWDMDGVLVDSGELHYQSWSVTLTDLPILFNRAKFHSTFGMNNHGILTVLLSRPPDAARQLGVPPEQSVVVEDAVAGVAAARKAGVKCITVCTTHPMSSLSAEDIIVDTLEELIQEDFYSNLS
jgi:beta-phosphoglucomutase-like phosphatase (HAD superfamily)